MLVELVPLRRFLLRFCCFVSTEALVPKRVNDAVPMPQYIQSMLFELVPLRRFLFLLFRLDGSACS